VEEKQGMHTVEKHPGECLLDLFDRLLFIRWSQVLGSRHLGHVMHQHSVQVVSALTIRLGQAPKT
jgi:hypothetical protein